MPRKSLFGLLALALLLAVLVSVPLAAMALADSPESEDPLDLYDENDDGVIDGDEFFSAVLDHLDGRIDRALASRVWQLWRGERASGAQSAKPTSSTTRVLNPSGYLEGECSAYDANDDNVISRDEAFDATDDYFAEGSTMTLEEVQQVVDCYDGDPPPPPVPGIPDEPTLTAENDEDVTATWRAVTHATSYRVRIKVKTDTGWLYTTSVREPTREFGGLASGTYHVQVMACNPAWCGGWSPSGEVPVGPPYFKEGDSADREVPENTAAGGPIGKAVMAIDPTGDPLTYSLSSTDAGSFTIDSSSGQVRTSAELDYEIKNSYTVTVQVTDGKDSQGNTEQNPAIDDTIVVTINVTDVNDEPTFPSTSTTRSVRENTPSGRNIGAPVAATDDDGDPLTYTLGGTDAGSFSIVSTTGQLRTSAALTKNSYTVTVSVRDSKDTASNADTATDNTITVTIIVTNEDDPGTVMLSTTVPQVGAAIDASLSDPDGGVTNESWQWQSSPDGTSGSWSDISFEATEVSYSPVSGDVGNHLRATVSYIDAHGPDKSATSEATSPVTSVPPVTSAKLAKPDEFSLNPLAHEKSANEEGVTRRAKLSWTGDESASEYVVQLRASGKDWTSAHSVTVEGAFLDIDLDEILPDEGLADDPYEYELRIKATYTGDTYEDSDYSETVTITNSPIIAVDGDSRDTYDENDNPTGKAKITRRAVTDSNGDEIATGYQIRWVKLPGDHTMSADPDADSWFIGPVSDDAWTLVTHIAWTPVPLEQGESEYTLEEELELHQIYAIQLNYTTEAGPGFSAQEFYVWPSARAAGNGELVATYAMRNYVPTREYAYYICEGSFPGDQDRRDAWTGLINDALGRWQTSTNGLVTMDHLSLDESPEESGVCYDFGDLVDDVLAQYDDSPSPKPGVREHVEAVLGRMQNIGMTQKEESKANEIWMIHDKKDERASTRHVYFAEVSRLVARGSCGPRAALGCAWYVAILEDENGRIILPGDKEFNEMDELQEPYVKVMTDILLSRSTLEDAELKIPASDVRFDTCKGTGKDYYAYTTLVHEVGHALGLSFRSVNLGDEQLSLKYSHPSRKLGYVAMGRSADIAACTPFPLDVMAIYALYQTYQ